MSRNIRKHQKVWVVDVMFFFWQLTVGMAQMESRWYTMVTRLLRRSSSEMLWRPSTSMPLWRMSKSGSAGTRDAACCNLATKPRASLEATSPFLLPQFSPSFPVKHCEQITWAPQPCFLVLSSFLTPFSLKMLPPWRIFFQRVTSKFLNPGCTVSIKFRNADYCT